MNRSVRTLLATALVLGIAGGTAGPVSAGAPADRAPGSRPAAPGAPRSQDAPDARALSAAIAGLPRQDAVAALVRVGGSAGSWRGSAGLHDLPSGGRRIRRPASARDR